MSNIPISSLPLALGLTATDVFIVVQGGTTKQVPLSTLAASINPGSPGSTAIILSGATSGSPYAPPAGVAKVLLDKTVGAASYVQFNLSSTYDGLPVLVKDIKGDAATNNITISFSGGEEADGLADVVIDVAFGAVWVNPLPGGGGFYLTAA
jgi:hypothetical protein